jgi:hypothetical protein
VSHLRFEAHVDGKWVRLPALKYGDLPGSISGNTLEGRGVVMFHCAGDHSVIEQSVFGADVEAGDTREVITAGTETLATLTDGQSYELDVVSDRGIDYRARWTHVA